MEPMKPNKTETPQKQGDPQRRDQGDKQIGDKKTEERQPLGEDKGVKR